MARQIAFLPLVGLIFFSVSGGAYGLEGLVSTSGPGMGLLLLAVMPLVYGAPIAAITTELATAIPVEGGTYEWAKRGLGNFLAFQAGLLRWVNSWVDMALYPILFANYLAVLALPASAGQTVFWSAGPFTIDLHWIVGVVCVIVPLGLLNIRGAKSVGDSSLLFTLIALAPLAVLSGLGISRLVTDHINPFSPLTASGTTSSAAFGAGLSLVMWSYCGFDRVGLIAGEIKDPVRVIPKAMLVSMGIIVASYVLPLAGALAVGGWPDWQTGSFGDIAKTLGGPWLEVFVTIGGMFGAIGLYSSLLLSNSRSVFVLAQDRWMSPALTKQSPRTGSPVTSVLVCSVIYALFSLGDFTDLVVLDVFLINLLLLINLAALIALRIKEPQLARPAKIPGSWAGVAAVGLPMTAVICYVTWENLKQYGLVSVWLVGGTLLLSTLAYVPARKYRRRNPLSTKISEPVAS
ncbi:APC family permease [Streptomyces sp. NPDC004752]